MLYLVRDHLFPVLVLLHALLAGRPPNDGHGRFAHLGHYRVARLARLPAPIRESSGLAPGDSAGLVWTHGDGGTLATLYEASLDGRPPCTDTAADHRLCSHAGTRPLAAGKVHRLLLLLPCPAIRQLYKFNTRP